jgi:hypothetical protein
MSIISVTVVSCIWHKRNISINDHYSITVDEKTQESDDPKRIGEEKANQTIDIYMCNHSAGILDRVCKKPLLLTFIIYCRISVRPIVDYRKLSVKTENKIPIDIFFLEVRNYESIVVLNTFEMMWIIDKTVFFYCQWLHFSRRHNNVVIIHSVLEKNDLNYYLWLWYLYYTKNSSCFLPYIRTTERV